MQQQEQENSKGWSCRGMYPAAGETANFQGTLLVNFSVDEPSSSFNSVDLNQDLCKYGVPKTKVEGSSPVSS